MFAVVVVADGDDDDYDRAQQPRRNLIQQQTNQELG